MKICPYLLNNKEYFDKCLHTQDLRVGTAKCHLTSAEILPWFKFWRKKKTKWKWLYLLNRMDLCKPIDIDKIKPRGLPNTFTFGRGFAEAQIVKKWNGPYILTHVEDFWCIFVHALILTRSSSWYLQMLSNCKIVKNKTDPISLTTRNILMDFYPY